jgi:hypothetical protein
VIASQLLECDVAADRDRLINITLLTGSGY